MSKTRFEYVRSYEQNLVCLKDTYIVIRLDGKNFHNFTKDNNFDKPNDLRALETMNASALEVCHKFNDVFIAYGQSDEYSFILDKSCNLFQRWSEKLISVIVSLFSSSYLKNFHKIFGDFPKGEVIFDAWIVLYPNEKLVQDYLSWRQADCHINNLYNTCFWGLVIKQGKTNAEAEIILKDTVSCEKQEIMFSQLGINYNNEKEIFKKGSIIIRQKQHSIEKELKMLKIQQEKQKQDAQKKLSHPWDKTFYQIVHEDLIKEDFWIKYYPQMLCK